MIIRFIYYLLFPPEKNPHKLYAGKYILGESFKISNKGDLRVYSDIKLSIFCPCFIKKMYGKLRRNGAEAKEISIGIRQNIKGYELVIFSVGIGHIAFKFPLPEQREKYHILFENFDVTNIPDRKHRYFLLTFPESYSRSFDDKKSLLNYVQEDEKIIEFCHFPCIQLNIYEQGFQNVYNFNDYMFLVSDKEKKGIYDFMKEHPLHEK